MPPYKRSRVSATRAAKTALRVGNWRSVVAAGRARRNARSMRRALGQRAYNGLMLSRVNRLESMIETKEGCRRITNVQLAHNNLTVFSDFDGNVFNPFISSQGATEPMAAGGMVRIGDKITVKGMKFKFFVEGSLQRSKVYIRFFLVRMAKGDTLDRTNFFKQACGNKMIDQINVERYTVIASKRVTLSAPNATAASLTALTGVPATTTVSGITGNAIFSMWVPGRKFGRNGLVTYENNSTSQVKFFDYRLCAVAYDWYGTPQDTNNVGFVNDGYVKIYFKDA